MLFTAGLTGLPGLCIFIWAFSEGGLGFLWIRCLYDKATVLYSFGDTLLVFVRGVLLYLLEIVIGQEVMYFIVIVVGVHNHAFLSFIGFCYYCIFLYKFVVYTFY
jgi:hypothetical protein